MRFQQFAVPIDFDRSRLGPIAHALVVAPSQLLFVDIILLSILSGLALLTLGASYRHSHFHPLVGPAERVGRLIERTAVRAMLTLVLCGLAAPRPRPLAGMWRPHED